MVIWTTPLQFGSTKGRPAPKMRSNGSAFLAGSSCGGQTLVRGKTIESRLALRLALREVNFACTGFAFSFEHRKWNRGRNGLHQLGQPVAPSILFPVFKSEGEPGTFLELDEVDWKM